MGLVGVSLRLMPVFGAGECGGTAAVYLAPHSQLERAGSESKAGCKSKCREGR